MSADAVSTHRSRLDKATRQIVLRTRGNSHGPITRLVSPGDLGQYIKPFVFLDYFDAEPKNAPRFGFHPHSGIATLTLILSGQAFYKETTDREGVIETGGVEWMRASGGIWHTGGMSGEERTKGFQLWVALPPALELAEPESQYLSASDFKSVGPARVITGEYDGVKSIITSPEDLTYLDVRLKAGDRWRFTPPNGHNVAWVASHEGLLSTPALARISHRIECIRAANQRKPLCHNHFSPNRGAPGCPRNVSRICLDLNLLKDARWWRRSTPVWSPRMPEHCCFARRTAPSR